MVQVRVAVVDIDKKSGAETPYYAERGNELAEFATLPKVGESILWNDDIDLIWLEVIRIEHFPTYPDRVRSPGERREPTLVVIAKWTWVD